MKDMRAVLRCGGGRGQGQGVRLGLQRGCTSWDVVVAVTELGWGLCLILRRRHDG